MNNNLTLIDLIEKLSALTAFQSTTLPTNVQEIVVAQSPGTYYRTIKLVVDPTEENAELHQRIESLVAHCNDLERDVRVLREANNELRRNP